jgi:hypothetical protein
MFDNDHYGRVMSNTYLARYPAVLQGCPTMRFLAPTPTSAYATTPLPPPTSLHTHNTSLHNGYRRGPPQDHLLRR